MDSTERVKMIHLMAEELEESVTAYQNARAQKENRPVYAGCDVSISNSKGAIQRKIIHIRQALLDLGQKL